MAYYIGPDGRVKEIEVEIKADGSARPVRNSDLLNDVSPKREKKKYKSSVPITKSLIWAKPNIKSISTNACGGDIHGPYIQGTPIFSASLKNKRKLTSLQKQALREELSHYFGSFGAGNAVISALKSYYFGSLAPLNQKKAKFCSKRGIASDQLPEADFLEIVASADRIINKYRNQQSSKTISVISEPVKEIKKESKPVKESKVEPISAEEKRASRAELDNRIHQYLIEHRNAKKETSKCSRKNQLRQETEVHEVYVGKVQPASVTTVEKDRPLKRNEWLSGIYIRKGPQPKYGYARDRFGRVQERDSYREDKKTNPYNSRSDYDFEDDHDSQDILD